MNTQNNTSRVLQEFVLEHREELANRLNLGVAEASELLADLGGSLCRRLLPEPPRPQGLKRLQQIIDHLGEGVVVADMQGELVDWNPAALRIHGFASVDEVRRNFATFRTQFELCEPGGTVLEAENWPLARLFRGETVRDVELVCRRPEIGQVRYIRYNGAVVPDDQGQPEFALMMLQDLTDQYQAHLGQLKLSKLLRAVSEATQDALFVKDLEGRYTWLNQAAARFVGLKVEEILGQDDSKFFDAKGVQLLQRRQREIVESEMSETVEETLTASGQTRTYLATKAPYYDELGQVAGIIGISRDVTAQKLAERQLGESESLLRAIIDNARAVIWVKSLDGRFRIVNQACCRYWQREANQIIGRTSRELFPELQADQFDEHEIQVLASGQPVEMDETLELDQEWKTFHSVKFPLLSATGEIQALAAISTDMTSSKRLEKQFWQAQKMDAVGRLAGGVAHDFNNQLTIILGNCDLVLYSMADGHPDRELLMEVYRAGERTARLTRQLLAFSRLSVTTPTPLDLTILVKDTTRILDGQMKDSIGYRLELEDGIRVLADAGQLEQLLLNLIANSCDAMPRGGADYAEDHQASTRRPVCGPFTRVVRCSYSLRYRCRDSSRNP